MRIRHRRVYSKELLNSGKPVYLSTGDSYMDMVTSLENRSPGIWSVRFAYWYDASPSRHGSDDSVEVFPSMLMHDDEQNHAWLVMMDRFDNPVLFEPFDGMRWTNEPNFGNLPDYRMKQFCQTIHKYFAIHELESHRTWVLEPDDLQFNKKYVFRFKSALAQMQFCGKIDMMIG